MNWGWKITLFYSGFVVFILTMVGMSMNQDFYLVTEKYYEADLNTDKSKVEVANTRKLSAQLIVNYSARAKQVSIQFPDDFAGKDVSGDIHLYRPSNGNLDQKIPLHLADDQSARFSTNEMVPGLWRVKISWSDGSLPYYFEQSIIL